MKKAIFSLCLFTLLLTACGQTTPPAAPALQKISLPVGYIPNIQFAPLYVAMENGYFRNAGLDVSIDYSFETDAMALVGADRLQFATVSGEQVLQARAQQLPIVYVNSWYKDYPVGIVSLKTAGISTPADLKGKTIGVPVLSGASYIGLRALLYAGGLTEQDVTLSVIGFNQVEALIAGQVDAAVVYIAHEPVQLRSRGFEVNLIKVSDYLQLVSNGLVTNETTLRQHPDLVSAMTKAIQQGVAYAAAHPEEAYEISKKYVENLSQADPVVQKAILADSIQLWQTAKPGYSDPAGWDNMLRVLQDMKLLKQPLDPASAYTNQFNQ